MRTAFVLICMVSAFLLSGCAFERAVDYRLSEQRYLLLEHGEVKQFQVVDISWRASTPGAATEVVIPVLARHAPKNLVEAGDLFRSAPPQRILAPIAQPNLASVIVGLTPLPATQPATGLRLSYEPVRWILSADPLIVGIGESRQRPNEKSI
jgi:hypothetical protein